MYLGTEFWKTVFVLKKKKKTCLVELIKKIRINKIKNMFENYFFN